MKAMSGKNRNPKSEIRKKSEVRSPKSEVVAEEGRAGEGARKMGFWRSYRGLAVIGGGAAALAVVAWLAWRFASPPDLAAERTALRMKARAELTAAETELLTTCGWMDRTRGIVHIPVDEALKLSERLAQNPAAARSNLLERLAKATTPGPRPPSRPGQYE